MALRLEAAANQGKIIHFDVVTPWQRPSRDVERRPTQLEKITGGIAIGILLVVVCTGALLARRNFRVGRGDRRGAFRIAFGLFALQMIAWLLGAHHVASVWEMGLFINGVGVALLLAALSWLLYIALEPYVRRRWPRTLVSWNRLLSLQLRDPLVGRDILVGFTAGIVMTAIVAATVAITGRFSAPPEPSLFDTDTLLGFRHILASLISTVPLILVSTLGNLILIFVLRVIGRRDWIAGALFVLVNAGLVAAILENHWIGFLLGAVTGAVAMVLLMRFGVVALIAQSFASVLLSRLPTSTDFAGPYLPTTIVCALALAAIALYAFRVALAGKTIFSEALLES